MRTVIMGAKGQLGSALLRAYEGDATGYDIKTLDIRDTFAFRNMLEAIKPKVVINCAAVQQIEWCQDNLRETYDVNLDAQAGMATVCNQLGVRFCTMSSSYVFDGVQERSYTEMDRAHPINVYGASKLAADELLPLLCPDYRIFRLTNLYGGTPVKGKTFIDRIIETARGGGSPVISEVLMSPSYVVDVAWAIRVLVETAHPGLYNVVNSNPTSLSGFARRALRKLGIGAMINDVPHTDRLRPRNSALNGSLVENAGVTMPSTVDGLMRYLNV